MIDALSIFNLSESFPKAIKLPVKVIPPIAKVKITKEFCNIFSMPELCSDHAIKNVANPPKPLNKATISGIDVILTLIAITDPTMAPRAMPPKIINGLMTPTTVTPTARNIANAEIKFPFTAVASFPSILIP